MGMLNDIVQAFGMLFSGRTPTEELPKDLSFKGKSVLITGATSGLGFETAVHYVKLGAFKVIITARSKAKGEKAKQEIEKRTGKMGILQVMVLDMDSFDGVKSFVKDLEKTVSRVDIVLLVSASPPLRDMADSRAIECRCARFRIHPLAQWLVFRYSSKHSFYYPPCAPPHSMDEEHQEGRSDPASRLHFIHLASHVRHFNMAVDQCAEVPEHEGGVQECVPRLRKFETAS